MDEVIRTVDLSAPLPQLVMRVMEELKPHIVKKEKVKGVRLQVEEWKIPEIVLREVLLNALLHRKYSIMGAIKVAVFSNRIEIFSPGNFPGPIDLSKLGNGVSYTRNPKLRQLARKAGLAEKRGMGFYIMLKACRENGNLKPRVEEGGDYVKVTLSLEAMISKGVTLGKEFAPLQQHMDNGEPLQPKLVSELLGVSINTARSRLMDLVAKGMMAKRGAGRGIQYHWTIE
jgi:ATP-dependent DNA helicase RecG